MTKRLLVEEVPTISMCVIYLGVRWQDPNEQKKKKKKSKQTKITTPFWHPTWF